MLERQDSRALLPGIERTSGSYLRIGSRDLISSKPTAKHFAGMRTLDPLSRRGLNV